MPSPELVFRSITAFQLTQALKGAIELDLFTAIAEGQRTPEAIGASRQAAPRGVRILCDYLTVQGFLIKGGGAYQLTPDSAMFLDRRQPSYVGGAIEFMLSPTIVEAFADVAGTVRKGGTLLGEAGTVSPDNPVWIRFARAMQPLAFGIGQQLPGLVPLDTGRPTKVLDIAASHGIYGLLYAQRFPQAEIFALDSPAVLAVGRENAARFGAGARWHELPGSAFLAEFPAGLDLVLVPNFFHHFDPPTCEALMRKIRAALGPKGKVVTVEFVPAESRIEPPASATFALTMLASTAAGDAYTFSEFQRMFAAAGFSKTELHQPPGGFEQVLVTER
jgi:ubiquinone/menaquinone biosynthesis C-methylase UbiE